MLLSLPLLLGPGATLDGVTFAASPRRVYVPVREIGRAFDRPVRAGKGGATYLGGRKLPAGAVSTLVDGTRLVSVRELAGYGFLVRTEGRLTTVKDKKRRGRYVRVRRGAKRAFVNKKAQTMILFQGRRPVMRTRISSGRAGKQTPTGLFRAQAYKNPLHRSRLYDGVAMPWSVQIVGNVFVHGFRSVPGRPASSGCIRVPLTSGNPARWFYRWVEPGTPVSILGKWPKNVR